MKSQIEASVENRLITALIGKEADTPKDRQTWETHLRSGQIEQQKIEIEVTVKEPENTMSIPGLVHIQKALSGSGRRTEKKTLTIAAARPILFEMESDKLVNTPDVTKQAMRAVEQDGIVFLDEIDKICSPSDRHYSGADASAEGVQRDLLPLIEGTTINTKFGNINTDHILFIASGAFHSVKPSDLMAELQGRLPIRVELKALTEDDLYSILTQTENNLIRQQIALLKTDNVDLSFTEAAIREIAKVAADLNRSVENIGARRLNTIIERIMDEISFTAADQPPGTKVVVDEKTVQEKVSDLLLKTDLAKFIL